MIYGKLWLVVKPTVGVPLFLGAVAVASFAVHYMLLTHTTSMSEARIAIFSSRIFAPSLIIG